MVYGQVPRAQHSTRHVKVLGEHFAQHVFSVLGKQLLSCALRFPSFLPLTFFSPVQLQFQVCIVKFLRAALPATMWTPHALCVQGLGCDLRRRPRPLASVPDLVPGTSSPSSVTKKPRGSHVPSASSLIPSSVKPKTMSFISYPPKYLSNPLLLIARVTPVPAAPSLIQTTARASSPGTLLPPSVYFLCSSQEDFFQNAHGTNKSLVLQA